MNTLEEISLSRKLSPFVNQTIKNPLCQVAILAPNLQLTTTKRTSSPKQVQANKPIKCTQVSPEERFPGKAGSVSSLFSYPNQTIPSQVSMHGLRQSSFQYDMSSFWPFKCASGLLENKQLVSKLSSSARDAHISVPGRFSDCSPKLYSTSGPDKIRHKPFSEARVDCELQMINNISDKKAKVSWSPLGYRVKPNRRYC